MTRVVGLLLLTGGLVLSVLGVRSVLSKQTIECRDQPFAIAQVAGVPYLTLELARTDAQRSRGLMFRQSMPEDQGMLFIFDRETSVGFWMRNTLIPLSIAFVDREGLIVDIQDMQPLDETSHAPPSPYWYALEVNQGWYERNGVNVGDRLVFCIP